MSAHQIFAQVQAQTYLHDGEVYWKEQPIIDPQAWGRSILGFINLPWFSRMWIIQESVANFDTDIVCGFASMNWLVFLFGLEKSLMPMWMTVQVSGLLQFAMSYTSKLESCRILVGHWKARCVDPPRIAACLAECLFRLAGTFECNDPRYRLFALLGLIPGCS